MCLLINLCYMGKDTAWLLVVYKIFLFNLVIMIVQCRLAACILYNIFILRVHYEYTMMFSVFSLICMGFAVAIKLFIIIINFKFG